MAHRLVRLEMWALVVNGTITLYDDAGRQVVPDLNDVTQWLFAGDNAVVLASAGHTDHRAALAIELWDAEPPPPAAALDDRQQRTVRLDSGDVEVHPGAAPPSTQLVRLGPPGRYHVRAHVVGRPDIARLTPNPDIDALRGVERFLLQFWPGSEPSPSW